jgi:Phage terminase large subunit
LGVQDYFQINKANLEVTCSNGYQIIFKGLDNVEKIKSITPAKGVITDIWIEEATESFYAGVKQLSKRLRGRSKVKKG